MKIFVALYWNILHTVIHVQSIFDLCCTTTMDTNIHLDAHAVLLGELVSECMTIIQLTCTHLGNARAGNGKKQQESDFSPIQEAMERVKF